MEIGLGGSGQGDLASRLRMGIILATIWVIGVVYLLTTSRSGSPMFLD